MKSFKQENLFKFWKSSGFSNISWMSRLPHRSWWNNYRRLNLIGDTRGRAPIGRVQKFNWFTFLILHPISPPPFLISNSFCFFKKNLNCQRPPNADFQLTFWTLPEKLLHLTSAIWLTPFPLTEALHNLSDPTSHTQSSKQVSVFSYPGTIQLNYATGSPPWKTFQDPKYLFFPSRRF